MVGSNWDSAFRTFTYPAGFRFPPVPTRRRYITGAVHLFATKDGRLTKLLSPIKFPLRMPGFLQSLAALECLRPMNSFLALGVELLIVLYCYVS